MNHGNWRRYAPPKAFGVYAFDGFRHDCDDAVSEHVAVGNEAAGTAAIIQAEGFDGARANTPHCDGLPGSRRIKHRLIDLAGRPNWDFEIAASRWHTIQDQGDIEEQTQLARRQDEHLVIIAMSWPVLWNRQGVASCVNGHDMKIVG